MLVVCFLFRVCLSVAASFVHIPCFLSLTEIAALFRKTPWRWTRSYKTIQPKQKDAHKTDACTKRQGGKEREADSSNHPSKRNRWKSAGKNTDKQGDKQKRKKDAKTCEWVICKTEDKRSRIKSRRALLKQSEKQNVQLSFLSKIGESWSRETLRTHRQCRDRANKENRRDNKPRRTRTKHEKQCYRRERKKTRENKIQRKEQDRDSAIIHPSTPTCHCAQGKFYWLGWGMKKSKHDRKRNKPMAQMKRAMASNAKRSMYALPISLSLSTLDLSVFSHVRLSILSSLRVFSSVLWSGSNKNYLAPCLADRYSRCVHPSFPHWWICWRAWPEARHQGSHGFFSTPSLGRPCCHCSRHITSWKLRHSLFMGRQMKHKWSGKEKEERIHFFLSFFVWPSFFSGHLRSLQ